MVGNIVSGKAKRTPEEVLEVLEEMESGKIDDYWWDDFLSVPIKSGSLDKIREECEGIYTENSPHLSKNAEGKLYLNETGKVVVRRLIEQCKILVEST